MTVESDPNDSGTEGTATKIQREDCLRCGGTGEIVKMVAGRSGMVSCPDCDNVQKSALPNDPPEDPHARIDELEERLDKIADEKQAFEENRSKLSEAASLIGEVANSELIDPDEKAILDHLSGRVAKQQQVFDEREIEWRQKTARSEIRELRVYIDAIEAQQEGEQ